MLRSRVTRLLFLPLTLAWLSAFAFIRPLATPDEGRYTHIARWMTQTGDWLIPRIDGLPFLHKPPLYYWLEALVIDGVGLNLFTARLVSIVAGLVTCGCVYLLARRYHDAAAARWSVAVLLTSPLFFAGAQFANLDMLVASLITLALTLAVFAVDAEPWFAESLWLASYAASAFAFLAKGLIGIAFPGGAFVCWALAKGRPELIQTAVKPCGVTLFLVITVPWFVAVELKIPGFIRYFFIYHHFERFLTDEFNGQHGTWFYPALVAAGLLPWTLAAPSMIRRYWRASDARHHKLFLLAGIWFTLVLVFFSLPSSKMIGYIFPLLPAAALLTGPSVVNWPWRWVTLAAGVVICVVLAVAGPHWQKYSPMGLADKLAGEIKPGDDVVFMDRIFYDVLVRLDRTRPVYLNGHWDQRPRDMPDSWQRQVAEGREFEAATGYVLVEPAGVETLLARPGATTWVFVEKSDRYPFLAKATPFAFEHSTNLYRIGPPAPR